MKNAIGFGQLTTRYQGQEGVQILVLLVLQLAANARASSVFPARRESLI
jgi:hypothetical protein